MLALESGEDGLTLRGGPKMGMPDCVDVEVKQTGFAFLRWNLLN
jgi:hypothetical protein